MSTPDVEEALYYLELLWGDEWELGHDPEKGYWATRRGKVGVLLTASTPEELGRKLEDAAGERQ